MKTMIWVATIVVALAFLAVGAGKLVTSTDELAKASMGVPVELLRIAGLAEVLGALGLVLPAATRIAPILTPIAAVGLCLVMVGAIISNIIVGAYGAIIMPVILLALSAWIAWARFGPHAITPRATNPQP